MVALRPYGDLPASDPSWEIRPAVDLRNSPEAPLTKFTKGPQHRMGSLTPETLANVLERLFAGLPW